MEESIHTDEKLKEKQDVSENNNETDEEIEQVIIEPKNKEAKDNQEVQSILKEKDEVYQRMLRIQAEFDNFKKRTQKERAADLKYKSQELVNELLPAMDNFERALEVEVTEGAEGIVEGISMVYNQLQEALKSQGVETIDDINVEFDPNLHHGVVQVEEEDMEPNMVAEVLQKGYKLKDKVVRAAMVKVTK